MTTSQQPDAGAPTSVPPQAVPSQAEGPYVQAHSAGATGAHPIPVRLERPAILAIKALANLIGRYGYLPDLEYTVLPNGVIYAQMPAARSAQDAYRDFTTWQEMLSHGGCDFFHDVPRYDGGWEWTELQGHIPVQPGVMGSTLMELHVTSRRYATTRPPVPAAPHVRTGA